MESSLQKIIAAIVGVLIMFIIPVYISFEKADDVSYSLAVKLTQNFVDNARNKGYISPEMYSDFVSGLYATNNAYDVEIEHIKKRYDPAIYIYEKTADNKKGELLHVLDYYTYLEQYKNGEIKIDVGVYNKTNSTIEVIEPSIKLNNGSSVIPGKTDREVYEDKIKQYNEQGRVIVSAGEVYGDVNKLVGNNFDKDIYIPSYIDATFRGEIKILNKQGNENTYLPYEQYKNAYFNSVNEIFWGPTYNQANIKYVPASMKIKGSTITAEEAEDMYYERINEYNSEIASAGGRIIFDKGEVYSESESSIGYDSEIDMIRNISVEGNIDIVNPTEWLPDSLDFDEYINEVRQNNQVEYLKRGVYDAVRTKGVLAYKSNNDVFYFDYITYEDKMLDDTDKIEIKVEYTNEDIMFDFENAPKVTVIDNTTNEIVINKDTNEIVTDDIDNISKIKDIVEDKEVIIDGIPYRGNVKVGTETYEFTQSSNYTIEISTPQFMALENKLPSTIYIIGEETEQYVKEYINNGNITINKEYYKTDLYFERESIELVDVGIKLYRNLNRNKYDEYLSNATLDSFGNVSSVTVDAIIIPEDKISVEYTYMYIDAREPISITPNNIHLVEQYYENRRVIVKEPSIYDTSEFVVQDAHIQIIENGNVIIDIYEKNNKTLYDEYKSQYLENSKITLKYNKNDISCLRAKIVITVLDTVENLSPTGEIKTIYDNETKYISYLSEYESKGYITIGNPVVYNRSQLEVVNPSITVKDPDTGEVIQKYEVDFSLEDGYDLYLGREIKYNTINQVINKNISYINNENCFFEKAHVINEEIITDKQIVAKLFRDTGVSKIEFLRQCMLGNGDLYNSLAYMNENSYVMNEGDKINVTVKNKTQTIASVFYSLLTANVGTEEIAKIYVDYGGTIKNSGEDIVTEEVDLINSKQGRLFKYRGQAEEVTLSPGRYKIECWGAAGGYPDSITNFTNVGRGAYSKAIFDVEQEITLYVYVGGKGTLYSEQNTENGGYNGGGNSYKGYGGGGSTDVRILRGDAEDISSMLTRIIVAAGAGGNSEQENGYGGSGGDLNNGIDGKPFTSTYRGIGASRNRLTVGHLTYIDSTGAIPITRSVPEAEQGSFGIGGSVDYDGAGAGGGGYFGGSAAHDTNSGGGGGLSYIYNNQSTSKDGKNYPLNSVITDNYETEMLENIIPYITVDGKWIGIRNIGMNFESLNGNSTMPSGITLGSNTMDGNKGNGFAIIKQCQSEGCED